MSGNIIPSIPDTVPGQVLTWRFPEPPNPDYPDRPFVLVNRLPISEPADWMHEQAAMLVEAHQRYYDAQVRALYESDAALLDGIVDGYQLLGLRSVIQSQKDRNTRREIQAHDRGVIAVDFQYQYTEDVPKRAVMYSWTHGYAAKVWDLDTHEYIYDGTTTPGSRTILSWSGRMPTNAG